MTRLVVYPLLIIKSVLNQMELYTNTGGKLFEAQADTVKVSLCVVVLVEIEGQNKLTLLGGNCDVEKNIDLKHTRERPSSGNGVPPEWKPSSSFGTFMHTNLQTVYAALT